MLGRYAPGTGGWRCLRLGRLGPLALGILLVGAEAGSLWAGGDQPGGSSRPFSFARDVGGILTKRGCNNQECHGSVKGRGGFKLSANALYPKDDYEWIVEGGVYQVLSPEPLGRRQARIDLKQPENSLLLTKSTMETPHGGGERLSGDSADYRTLVEWIRDGAPYGREEDHQARRIHRLEVAPRQPVMQVGGGTAASGDGHSGRGAAGRRDRSGEFRVERPRGGGGHRRRPGPGQAAR